MAVNTAELGHGTAPSGIQEAIQISTVDDTRTSAGRRISVAFFLHTLDLGGLQLSMLRLAISLHRIGFKVCILVQKGGGQLAPRVPPGIDIVSLHATHTITGLPGLVRFLRRERPDVVVSGLVHGNLALVAAARLAGGVKTLITEHAPPRSLIAANAQWRYGVLPILIRQLYPKADAIVAVSRGVREELMSMLPVSTPVDLIYNPVVPDDVQQLAQGPAEDPWMLDGEVPFIVGVGRLSHEKRFDVLIRAFALVVSERPLNLLILGEGPERPDLQKLIDELQLRNRVQLKGYVANPFPYMRAARMLAVTSEFEGFGNVLVEAMACGTPVISTDCPFGPHEVLQGGRYGRLLPIGDVAATAEAIRATLAAEPQRGALCARAQQFSVESSVESYADLIRRLAAPTTGAITA